LLLTLTTLSRGEDLELGCTGEGSPEPSSTWFRGDLELVTSRNNVTWLVIPNVTLQDAGEYRCERSNSFGDAHVNTTIIVESAPRLVKPFNTTSLNTTVGSVVEVECVVDGYPVPTTTVTLTEGAGSTVLQHLYNSSYQLTTNSSLEAGMVACRGESVLGEVEASRALYVHSPFKIATGAQLQHHVQVPSYIIKVD